MSNDIENLVLPNSLADIDSFAYQDNQIRSITFPDSLKVIRRGVFYANNISTLELPSGLEKIEVDAFYQNNISELDLPATLTYLSGFRENNFTELEIPSHVKIIGPYAFSYNPTETLTLNEGLEEIGDYSFWTGAGGNATSSLKSTIAGIQGTITIPSTVKSIGAYAFEVNSDLTKVILQDGLETIGSFAFGYCGLTEVDIPSSVITIGSGAFSANSITSVSLPDGLEEIKSSAFSENAITCITIPGTVKNIGDEAFYANNTMDTIVINNGVETIGEKCFSYNQSINNITLPNSLLQIKENAFFNSFFTAVTLPTVIKEREIFDHWATYSGDSTNTIEEVESLSSNNENGYIAIFSDTSTGIDPNTENQLIYTNPVYSTFTINQSGIIEIYNMYGNKIISQKIEVESPINLSNLPSGVYIFALNKSIKGKFIKE